jgi:predicted DNA-binding transcriptional regulator YafY
MRTIDRLRYEFGVPIEYDESNRGYYLTNPNFSFAALPPDRDELIALLILREIASIIDDTSIHVAISALWIRITNGRADIDCDLARLRNRFSAEAASVAKLPSVDLLGLISLCHRGQMVQVRYRSPWDGEAERDYVGTFERLHLYDGTFYGMFTGADTVRRVLNLSFVGDIQEVSQVPAGFMVPQQEVPAGSAGPDGVGTWSGSTPEMIEIRLAPPGTRYYAAQVWHDEQEDLWNGDVLTRRFPGTASRALLRRVLSLGRFVVEVKPAHILEQLREDALHLALICGPK